MFPSDPALTLLSDSIGPSIGRAQSPHCEKVSSKRNTRSRMAALRKGQHCVLNTHTHKTRKKTCKVVVRPFEEPHTHHVSHRCIHDGVYGGLPLRGGSGDHSFCLANPCDSAISTLIFRGSFRVHFQVTSSTAHMNNEEGGIGATQVRRSRRVVRAELNRIRVPPLVARGHHVRLPGVSSLGAHQMGVVESCCLSLSPLVSSA